MMMNRSRFVRQIVEISLDFLFRIRVHFLFKPPSKLASHGWCGAPSPRRTANGAILATGRGDDPIEAVLPWAVGSLTVRTVWMLPGVAGARHAARRARRSLDASASCRGAEGTLCGGWRGLRRVVADDGSGEEIDEAAELAR